jgi:hypothetical protein
LEVNFREDQAGRGCSSWKTASSTAPREHGTGVGPLLLDDVVEEEIVGAAALRSRQATRDPA